MLTHGTQRQSDGSGGSALKWKKLLLTVLLVLTSISLPLDAKAQQGFFIGDQWFQFPADAVNASIINWDTLSGDLQSSGINWSSIYSAEIQGSGINWASPASSVFTFTGSMTVDGSLSVVGTMSLDGETGFGTVKIDGDLGGCIMSQDSDNAGFTKCITLNGTMTCAIDADGNC